MDSIFNTRYLYLTDLIETTLSPTDVFVFTKSTPLDEVKYVNAVITAADLLIALGSGTVTNFTSGNLAPLFTTNVATSTSTPALTYTLTVQNANTVFAGPSAGIAAVPTFRALVLADLPAIPASTLAQVLVAGNTTGGTDITMSAGDSLVSLTTLTLESPVFQWSSDLGVFAQGWFAGNIFGTTIGAGTTTVSVSTAQIVFDAPIYRFFQLTGNTAVYLNATKDLVSIPFTSNGDVFTLVGGIPSWAPINVSSPTGVLPIANGGTNSGVALVNNRMMISSAGTIIEHVAQLTGCVLFTNGSGLPDTDLQLRWNDTDKTLAVGGVPLSSNKVLITTSLPAQTGLLIVSTDIGVRALTTSLTTAAGVFENSSTITTPFDIISIDKSSHAPTNGSGQYIKFLNVTNTSGSTNIGQFGTLVTDITAGTYKSAFVWNTPNETDGTMVERMRLTSAGALGINTTPDASAILDLSSTTKGLLLPRMTGAQANLITPVNGLIVYITAATGTFAAVGFWGYQAGVWIQL